jgi:hypothetical protein
MHDDLPALPDFLNRKLNPSEPRELPKRRAPRKRKPKGEVLRLYLLNKRGFGDGFHACEFVKRTKKRVGKVTLPCVTVRIGKRLTNVTCEQWDRAHAKWHGRDYVPAE